MPDKLLEWISNKLDKSKQSVEKKIRKVTRERSLRLEEKRRAVGGRWWRLAAVGCRLSAPRGLGLWAPADSALFVGLRTMKKRE